MLITPVQPHNSLNIVSKPRPSRPNTDNAKTVPKLPELPLPQKKAPIRKGLRSRTGGAEALARKRLLMELKLQETMRKTAEKQAQNIETHREDLIERKKMLSDILKEYEQISKDKNVLTAEIKNMKKYLSDIRSKLDQSLTVLNKNTTLFAMKRGISSQIPIIPKAKTKRLKKVKKSVLQGKNSETRNILRELAFK